MKSEKVKEKNVVVRKRSGLITRNAHKQLSLFLLSSFFSLLFSLVSYFTV